MCSKEQQARWRAKVKSQGGCRRCGGTRLPGTLHCGWCLAYDLEKARPGMEHDRAEHALMLSRSHRETSRCAASGLTSSELRSIGSRLTVDRIDNDRGYVRGNMQLLAWRLNWAKGQGSRIPDWEVDRLLRMHRGENMGDFGGVRAGAR